MYHNSSFSFNPRGTPERVFFFLALYDIICNRKERIDMAKKSTRINVRIEPEKKTEFMEYCETILGEKDISKVLRGFIYAQLDAKKKILENYQK